MQIPYFLIEDQLCFCNKFQNYDCLTETVIFCQFSRLILVIRVEMSSASKSKSKDKSTPRAGKEQSKVSIKSSPVHAYGGNGSSASVYNPALGTFHTLDISPPSSVPQSNGRFRTIDDSEDHSGNSPATTAEYDSLSNNDSCSGESEDQKEKPTSTAPRIDAIPGCDNDKRDKIRQKNERKHQRQREKRAHDLHDRSNAFLTSRKFETLKHQLVVMGFPPERATRALIINEGRMEESVAWLLHEAEENNRQQVLVNLEDKSHIKLDITDELARVAEFEVKFKCTKQDVERAVVACEGDLLKAEESLRSQLKQAATIAATPKSDEYVNSNGGLNNKIAAPNHNPVLTRSPIKGSTSVTIQQQRRDEKDLINYKTMVPGTLQQEYANINLQQALKKMQLKPTDKRWSSMSGAPPVSYPPLTLTVQVSGPSLKSESQFAATMGHEVQTGALKEPSFIVMRRPKQQNSPSSSIMDMSVSPPASTGWYPNGSPALDILAAANGVLGHNHAGIGSSGSSLPQFYPQSNFHPMLSGQADLSAATGWSNQSLNASGTTSSLANPASLGLFTTWGSSSGSSPSSAQNDWNTGGLTVHRDYTSIDWSLDLTSLRPSSNNDSESDSWSKMFMGGNAATRPLMNVGGGVYLPGLQEGSGLLTDHHPSVPSNNSHEWSNPFEGSDLLMVPRQYVTSPSL